MCLCNWQTHVFPDIIPTWQHSNISNQPILPHSKKIFDQPILTDSKTAYSVNPLKHQLTQQLIVPAGNTTTYLATTIWTPSMFYHQTQIKFSISISQQYYTARLYHHPPNILIPNRKRDSGTSLWGGRRKIHKGKIVFFFLIHNGDV